MSRFLSLVLLGLGASSSSSSSSASSSSSLAHGAVLAGKDGAFPAYQELYYNQTLDHFPSTSTRNTSAAPRWPHRYLLNDDNWDGSGNLTNGCKGPILLYTGNEGPITAFWESNGFMIETLAPKWGALVVFPEERFYGKSQPFGVASPVSAQHLKYLTTEQVLADIAELVAHLKSTLSGAENCPVVAFGGSYGGTLTTFLRFAYPDTVVGGLAASAPIGYYDKANWPAHGVTETTWTDIVGKVYDEADKSCTEAIQTALLAIESSPTNTLVKAFHVCDATGLGPNGSSDLFVYALESMPQSNYPYAIGSLPAWPVNATCDTMVAALGDTRDDAKLIAAAAAVTLPVLGYDGTSCLATLSEGPGGVPGDGPGLDSWGWQSCTENLHQFSAKRGSAAGPRAEFRDYTFNLAKVQAYCNTIFNNTAKMDNSRLADLYGGYKLGDGLTNISNVIWSNGLLDPWHGGGFLTEPAANLTNGNHWFLFAKGAHHLDLRGPNTADPAEVTAARDTYETIIKGWIDAFTAV